MSKRPHEEPTEPSKRRKVVYEDAFPTQYRTVVDPFECESLTSGHFKAQLIVTRPWKGKNWSTFVVGCDNGKMLDCHLALPDASTARLPDKQDKLFIALTSPQRSVIKICGQDRTTLTFKASLILVTPAKGSSWILKHGFSVLFIIYYSVLSDV